MVKKFKTCAKDVKSYLFKTYCANVYGCHLWYRFSKTVMDKIKIAYNTVFRKLMRLDRMCSISTNMVLGGVPTFIEVVRKSCSSFIKRIQNSTNQCVRCISDTVLFLESPLYQHWQHNVYTVTSS